jgi:RNA-editing ligase
MLRKSLLWARAGGPLRRTRRLLFEGSEAQGFEKYAEMDNATLSRVQPLRTDTDEWIATEKVHGANFGVYVTKYGQGLRFAKRTAFLGESENFFGYHCLIPEMRTHALAVRELVGKKLGKDVETLIVNGELFGGKYQHTEVKRSNQSFQLRGALRGVSSVQKEQFPQYTPDLAFYAFDIKYRLEPDLPPASMTFDDASEIFAQVPGLLYQRALIRGPLDKILAFNVETFTTTVPGLMGGTLAKHYIRNNWSEGIVARHAKRGVQEMEGKTSIIKIKCTAFQELKKDRNTSKALADPMADARAMAIERVGPQLPVPSAVLPTKALEEACAHLVDHVCQSRLNNLVSKEGPDTLRAMSPDQVAKMLAQDCLKDFLKEAKPDVVNMPILYRRELARYVLAESRKYVTKHWESVVTPAEASSGAA